MRNLNQIVEYFENKDFTAYYIASKTGLTELGVRKILNKTSKNPREKTLKELSNFIDKIEANAKSYTTNESELHNLSESIEVNYLDGLTSSVLMVPLVNQYAYAGYLSGYGDDEFISELPKIPFIVDREYKGEYICFEVKGDSMECESNESINEGDILLCRNVRQDYWKSKLHISKWDFVIVHKTRGIVVKRITNHNVDTGEITLHSLNEMYPDYTVNLSEVEKLFNIVEVKKKRKRR